MSDLQTGSFIHIFNMHLKTCKVGIIIKEQRVPKLYVDLMVDRLCELKGMPIHHTSPFCQNKFSYPQEQLGPHSIVWHYHW